jgi:hypothetical protein
MGVFATLAVSREGIVAAIYSAQAIEGTMLILDYDAGPMQGDLFAGILARLRDLAAATRARLGGVAIYVQPDMVRQAHVAGIRADAIPEHLRDAEMLLLPAASHIAAGRVKLCEPAHNRAQTSPFGGALDFRGGDCGDDPLRRAALWAITLALDPAI